MNIPDVITFLDLIGVAVFAASGGLVASRKEMDLIGFGLMATLTGLGGGTLRDLLLGQPVFWVQDQSYLLVCFAVALFVFFTAHLLQRRYVFLIWADALGLAAFGVMGAHIALEAQTPWLQSILFGMMTATFGGLARDVVAGEPSLFTKPEVYVTAPFLGAGVYVLLSMWGTPIVLAVVIGVVTGFAIRSGGIIWKWELPRYKGRAGRDYK
jgi:uncharacterized membrane protein YeiH